MNAHGRDVSGAQTERALFALTEQDAVSQSQSNIRRVSSEFIGHAPDHGSLSLDLVSDPADPHRRVHGPSPGSVALAGQVPVGQRRDVVGPPSRGFRGPPYLAGESQALLDARPKPVVGRRGVRAVEVRMFEGESQHRTAGQRVGGERKRGLVGGTMEVSKTLSGGMEGEFAGGGRMWDLTEVPVDLVLVGGKPKSRSRSIHMEVPSPSGVLQDLLVPNRENFKLNQVCNPRCSLAEL